MARKATGQVLDRKTKRGIVFALRFHDNGERQYVTLGGEWEGWTAARAQDELANALADVRRGIWRPPTQARERSSEIVGAEPSGEPRFDDFASAWFAQLSDSELADKTKVNYRLELTEHLLPFFGRHPLSEITAEQVDRYRHYKLREAHDLAERIEQARRDSTPVPTVEVTDRNGHSYRRLLRPLSPTSINKTITRLGQILEQAVEYGYLERNPARGRRRRVRASKPAPVWLDRAEHIEALLDAASELDREARADRGHIARRALLATLVFGGLRLGELTRLRWRDVDLAGNRVTVAESKTDAGRRVVDMVPALRDELAAHKAALTSAGRAGADAPVFPTATGRPLSGDNVRSRVFAAAVQRANDRLEAVGEVPLPAGLTPHKLRHTYTSLLVALGVDPGAVMDQVGHTDPTFTLRVYRHAMRRSSADKAALQTLVGAGEGPYLGTESSDKGTSALSSATVRVHAGRR